MAAGFEPKGAFTALVTPFTADDTLDVAALRKLCRFQADQGIDGLVPCGTTGESPTLAWEDHDAVVAAALDEVGGRLTVIAGTGSNNTTEAIEATETARRLGASAALLVDCYYNGPSSLELRTEYYERVLDAVPDIPIVPYIIPGRSGCALSAADLAFLHLTDPRRVPAVKEATGDLGRMREDRLFAGPGLAILSGDDDMTLPMMADDAIGASGVISVMSNIVPGAIARMVAAQANHDEPTARRLRDGIAPLLRLVTCATRARRTLPGGAVVATVDKFRNPVPVKTMMAGLGMTGPGLRRPLGPMSPEAVAACREGLQAVHGNAPELLSPIGEAFEVDVAARLADDALWASLARRA